MADSKKFFKIANSQRMGRNFDDYTDFQQKARGI